MGASNSESLLQTYGLGVAEGQLRGSITWDGVEYIILGVPMQIEGLQKEPRQPESTEKSS